MFLSETSIVPRELSVWKRDLALFPLFDQQQMVCVLYLLNGWFCPLFIPKTQLLILPKEHSASQNSFSLKKKKKKMHIHTNPRKNLSDLKLHPLELYFVIVGEDFMEKEGICSLEKQYNCVIKSQAKRAANGTRHTHTHTTCLLLAVPITDGIHDILTPVFCRKLERNLEYCASSQREFYLICCVLPLIDRVLVFPQTHHKGLCQIIFSKGSFYLIIFSNAFETPNCHGILTCCISSSKRPILIIFPQQAKGEPSCHLSQSPPCFLDILASSFTQFTQ